MNTIERQHGERFAKLLLLAIPESENMDEAIAATELAMQYEAAESVSLGLDAQGRFHGPQPPGPGWTQVGTGEKGGKIWAQQQSGPQTLEQFIEGEWRKLSKPEQKRLGTSSELYRQWDKEQESKFHGGQQSSQPQKQAASHHPLQGLTPDQQLQKLITYTGYQAQHEPEVQWRNAMMAVPVPDEKQKMAQAGQILAENKRKNPFAHTTVVELAHALQLEPMQFQHLMYDMRDAGQIRLHPFTQAAYQLPKEAYPYVIPSGQDLKMYVEPVDVSAAFSFDIFNREAQGILNRAMKVAKELSASAKRELEDILKIPDPGSMAEGVVAFVNKYRIKLADLLGSTQLAALLSGASEVARRLPPIPLIGTAPPPPPTLPPDEAEELIKGLRKLPLLEQHVAIYDLPVDQQAYVRAMLHSSEGLPPKQPFVATEGEGERIHFPIIEEAAKELAKKNLVDRRTFDALTAATRAKAFTVAGVDAQDTLRKVRDALAENIEEGADFATFKAKVLEEVSPGTFLSDAHMETVFRANVQGAFSDGQMQVLSHPFVRSGFPYAEASAIHDDRVRPEHLEIEKIGIEGGPIFRINDPVFQTFRGPWDFNCRCSWIPLTIMQAAERGVSEAKKWASEGVEPTPPAFVQFPSFRPPEGFQRALEGMPLSIRLSVEMPLAMDQFGIYHGPESPGAGWVNVGEGPRHGKRWKFQGHPEQANSKIVDAAYKNNLPAAEEFDTATEHFRIDAAVAEQFYPQEAKLLSQAIEIAGLYEDRGDLRNHIQWLGYVSQHAGALAGKLSLMPPANLDTPNTGYGPNELAEQVDYLRNVAARANVYMKGLSQTSAKMAVEPQVGDDNKEVLESIDQGPIGQPDWTPAEGKHQRRKPGRGKRRSRKGRRPRQWNQTHSAAVMQLAISSPVKKLPDNLKSPEIKHQPQSPGPGWVEAGVGPKGGKAWRFEGRQQTPTQQPVQQTPAQQPAAKQPVSKDTFAEPKPPKSVTSIEPAPTPQPVQADWRQEPTTERWRADKEIAKQEGHVPNKLLPNESRPQLTSDEMQALADYSETQDIIYNAHLRRGEALPEESAAGLKTMKNIFAKTKPLASPVAVYRGMEIRNPDDLQTFIAKVAKAGKEGTVAEWGGYMSTSTRRTGAMGGNVQMRILAKNGIDMKPYSTLAHQDEFLLDHNSKFKIKSVVRHKQTETYFIDMEQEL
jgi:ADP-ribosyltransferase exoenzyme/Phage Mu protein F like protein